MMDFSSTILNSSSGSDSDAGFLANLLSISAPRRPTSNAPSYISADEIKISPTEKKKILDTAAKREADLQNFTSVFRDWMEHHKAHPERIIELIEGMQHSNIIPKIGLQKEANVDIPEYKNGNLLLPKTHNDKGEIASYYMKAPVEIFRDVLNASFSEYESKKQEAQNLMGGVFNTNAYEPAERERAENNFVNKVIDAYTQDLLHNFAEGLRDSYTKDYKSYGNSPKEDSAATDEYHNFYNAITAEIKAKSTKDRIDFAQIDSLYALGERFGSGDEKVAGTPPYVPAGESPLEILKEILNKTSLDPEDRAKALCRIINYSVSYNKVFSQPFVDYLNNTDPKKGPTTDDFNKMLNDPTVVVFIDLEKQIGIRKNVATNLLSFDPKEERYRIRERLTKYPPYAGTVAILEATKNLDPTHYDELDKFSIEALARIDLYNSDDALMLVDLNQQLRNEVGKIATNDWEAADTRLAKALKTLEDIPVSAQNRGDLKQEERALIERMNTYLYGVPNPAVGQKPILRADDKQQAIFLLNIENVANSMRTPMEKNYFNSSHYRHFSEALDQMEALYNSGDNRLVEINYDVITPDRDLKLARKSSKEIAKLLEKVDASFKEFLDKHPKEEWWKLDAEGYKDITYTQNFVSEIVTKVDDNGGERNFLQTVYTNASGAQTVVYNSGINLEIRRGPNGAIPDFAVLMNEMAKGRQLGWKNIEFNTDDPQYFRMMALAAARHGIECKGPAFDSLTKEEQEEIKQIREEFRKESPLLFFNDDFELKEEVQNKFNEEYEKVERKAELALFDKPREKVMSELNDDKDKFNSMLTKRINQLDSLDLAKQFYRMTANMSDVQRNDFINHLKNQAGNYEPEDLAKLRLTKDEVNRFLSAAYQTKLKDAYDDILRVVSANPARPSAAEAELADRFVKGETTVADLMQIIEKDNGSNPLLRYKESDITAMAMTKPDFVTEPDKYRIYAKKQKAFVIEQLSEFKEVQFNNLKKVILSDSAVRNELPFDVYIQTLHDMRDVRSNKKTLEEVTENLLTNLPDGVGTLLNNRQLMLQEVALAKLASRGGVSSQTAKMTDILYDEKLFHLNKVIERISRAGNPSATGFEQRAADNKARYTNALQTIANAYKSDRKQLALDLEAGGLSPTLVGKVSSGAALTGEDVHECVKVQIHKEDNAGLSPRKFLEMTEVFDKNQEDLNALIKQLVFDPARGVEKQLDNAKNMAGATTEQKELIQLAIATSINDVFESRKTKPLSSATINEAFDAFDKEVADLLQLWCGEDIRTGLSPAAKKNVDDIYKSMHRNKTKETDAFFAAYQDLRNKAKAMP